MLAVALAAVFTGGPNLYSGRGYLFRMTPPRGWIQKAPAPGNVAEFRWVDARITWTAIPKEKKKRIEKVIDETLTEAKKALPGSLAAAAGSFKTEVGDTGYLFAVGPAETEGDRLLLCFYDTPLVVVVTGLASPNREAQTRALDGFVPCFKSFGFITEKVLPKS